MTPLARAVLLVLALAAADGFAQEADTESLIDVLTQFANQEDPVAWLESRPSLPDIEVARRAHSLGQEAIQQQNPGLAAVALQFSAHLLRIHGAQAESLTAFLDLVDLQFLMADTLPAYENTIVNALTIRDRALDLENRNLAFRATLTAADSAHFGTPLAPRQDQSGWQRRCMELLVETGMYGDANESATLLEKYASLMAVTLDAATSEFGYAGAEIMPEDLITALVADSERLIPADFRFEVAGGPEKSRAVAASLASVSYRSGNAAVASARLASWIPDLRASGAIPEFLSFISLRYRGEKQAGFPKAQLRQLRAEMRQQFEALRATYRSRAGRLWAAQSADEIFSTLVADDLEGGAPTGEVFVDIERLKAQLLLDQRATAFRDLTGQSRSRADDLAHEILAFAPPRDHDLFAREMRLVSRVPVGGSFDHASQAQKIRQLEQLYAAANAGFQGAASVASLAELQSGLQPTEALVEYFIPYHRLHPAQALWVVVVTPSSVSIREVSLEGLPRSSMIGSIAVDGAAPVDASPLTDAVTMLRVSVQRSDEQRAAAYLRYFGDLLLGPVEAQLDLAELSRLIVVPHGPLHHVPFPALEREGAFLIERVPLVVAPSASVWLDLARASRRPLASLFAAGAPVLADGGLPELDAAAAELNDLESLFRDDLDVEVLQGKAASASGFLSAAGGHGILHVASHGDFSEQSALDLHRLLLTPTDERTGDVTARDLASVDLRDTHLAVLNVCNGAMFAIGPADEPYGLVAALLRSGTANILASRWRVEDRFGRLFMGQFYRHLKETLDPAVAYQQTAKDFITEQELTRRWATFMLMGVGRPIR